MNETVTQAVETPAPDAIVQQAPTEAPAEQPAAPSPAAADTGESERRKGVGARIDELTRLRRDAERDRDHWRELAMRGHQQPKAHEPQADAKPKTLADFEFNDAEFQSYLFKEAEKRATAAAREALKAEQEQAQEQKRRNEFTARERKFAETQPDYFEVTRAENLSITQEMVDALADSEDAAALLYYIAKNADEAERIAQLSPKAAARALGRIEERLSAEREKAKAKPVVSQAPPPPPKLEAKEASVEKDPSEMTDAEFAKWRKKQIAARR